MVVYQSAGIFVAECGRDLVKKVQRLNMIIDALEIAALDSAATSGISDYDLDDGQTKIKQTYRNPAEITRSIVAFEAIKQRYVNQINGSVIRLVDEKNFTRYNNGRF